MDKIVLSEKDIEKITTDFGAKITDLVKNDDKTPIVLGVMKGALNFMMDLVKHVNVPLYYDFIQISSYSGTETCGSITLKKDISIDCYNRTVIVVEDIIDTGLSMHFLINHIKATQHPKRIIIVALFDKQKSRKVPVQVDLAGRVLDTTDFLLGYGLDYNELCRNTPYVYAATPEQIKTLDYISGKK